MIIGIDHGNRNMKTSHCIFTSGYTVSDKRDEGQGNEILSYNGKYYSIASEPFNVLNDKTVNENFFILSLFAIAKEMIAINAEITHTTLELAIGLPPRDYSRLKTKYELYYIDRFKNGVAFTYQGREFNIVINKCKVYPQGFAAAMSSDKASYITDYSTSFLIDIGGFTVDYMEFNDSLLNKNRCGSDPFGVISLIDHLKSEIYNKFGIDVTYMMIEGVIREKKVFMNEEIKRYINSEVQTWVDDKILGAFTKKNIDLYSYPVVFIGGGSFMLKKFIDNSSKLSIHEYVDDICANAKGYELFASKAS